MTRTRLLGGSLAVAAALAVLVPPANASAESDASGCRTLPGRGWHREVIPPAPRQHGPNAAFERSGLWQFILAGAATEGLTIAEAAKVDLGPAATVYDLQRAAYDGWLVVDSWVDTYPSDAPADPVVPARVGNHVVCWRYATPAEADLDGIPGGDVYPAWYAWFSNDPARPAGHHRGVPQPGR